MASILHDSIRVDQPPLKILSDIKRDELIRHFDKLFTDLGSSAQEIINLPLPEFYLEHLARQGGKFSSLKDEVDDVQYIEKQCNTENIDIRKQNLRKRLQARLKSSK